MQIWVKRARKLTVVAHSVLSELHHEYGLLPKAVEYLRITTRSLTTSNVTVRLFSYANLTQKECCLALGHCSLQNQRTLSIKGSGFRKNKSSNEGEHQQSRMSSFPPKGPAPLQRPAWRESHMLYRKRRPQLCL
jgi:hypothetical protein